MLKVHKQQVMKTICVPLLLATIATPIVFARIGEDSVRVTLYYETYCPDSTQHFQEKFYHAWKLSKSHVSFELVPFGKARQNYVHGHWRFHCQHGLKECQANKLHACAIYQLCGDAGTRDCAVEKLDPVMNFIYCMFGKPDQLKETKLCAKYSGLNGDVILKCAFGAQGDTLLSKYGNRTSLSVQKYDTSQRLPLTGNIMEQPKKTWYKRSASCVRKCKLRSTASSRLPMTSHNHNPVTKPSNK